MTEPTIDQIRDLLGRAASDAPIPHTWAEIERRAAESAAPSPSGRRPAVWLAIAASLLVVVAGFAVFVDFGDDPDVRIDDPATSTVPSTPTSTSTTPTDPGVESTTDRRWESPWTGMLLDDIDVGALRPLALLDLMENDEVVPTAPSGWKIEASGWTRDDPLLYPNVDTWYVDVAEVTRDDRPGQHLFLRMAQFPTCLGCPTSGESVTIDGVVWEAIIDDRNPEDGDEPADATMLRGRVRGGQVLSLVVGDPLLLNGPLLDNPLIIDFLGGLRAASGTRN